MSFDSLLIHEVDILNPTDSGDDDRYGNAVPGTPDSTGAPARVQQNASSEDIIDRDTRKTTFTAFLPADTAITALSTIVWDSRTFRLEGEPDIVDGATGPHHIEARLVEILG